MWQAFKRDHERDKALARQAVHKELVARREAGLSSFGLSAPVRCCECNQVVEKSTCITHRESSKCKEKNLCDARRQVWLSQGRSRRSRG